jgi:4-hydroxy-2-oxoheptanedioate aldolase
MVKSRIDVIQNLIDIGDQLVYVKAEFEAEGTRADELALLKSVISIADSNLVIKIGGSSALRDLIECSTLETAYVLVPMIETAEALSVFLQKRRQLVATLGLPSIFSGVLINIETKTAVKNLEDILAVSNQYDELQGLVIGRTDLTCSLQIPRENIESDEVFEICRHILVKSKSHNLKVTLGGNITARSYSSVDKLSEMGLDAFETRKCCIKAGTYDKLTFTSLIEKALLFEQSILQVFESLSKISYQQKIERIHVLKSRNQ